MKMQREVRQLQSIHEFEQYFNYQQPSNSPNYQRIKQQVNNLIFQPPENFKVIIFQETKVRIVLRIWYFVPNSSSEEKKLVKIKSKRNNQRKKSPPKMNKVQRMFMEDDEDVSEVKNNFDEKPSSEQNYILFTCIIDYGIYPFSPPYLFVTQNIGISHNLSINNFSNITDEILSSSNWFPSFTIEDILKNIPDFVENLKQNEQTIKSSYYYEKHFRKADIHQHALGLKIYEGQVYDTKDAFVGKYVRKVIGITFKSLIFFKKDDTNGLKVCNLFPLNQIEKIKLDENPKRIKFTITFKKKIEVSYKFVFSETYKNNSQEIEFRQHFLYWMKLCLFNTIYENFKKNMVLTNEGYMNLKQNLNKKSSKVHNRQNENSIHNFTKGLQERDLSQRKKVMQESLIQKQQHILKILETVDLLMSSSVYRTYEKGISEQIDETIYFAEKGVIITQFSNSKMNSDRNRKSIQKQKQNEVDLTKNQFLKLKNYKQKIQKELKQLFSQF